MNPLYKSWKYEGGAYVTFTYMHQEYSIHADAPLPGEARLSPDVLTLLKPANYVICRFNRKTEEFEVITGFVHGPGRSPYKGETLREAAARALGFEKAHASAGDDLQDRIYRSRGMRPRYRVLILPAKPLDGQSESADQWQTRSEAQDFIDFNKHRNAKIQRRYVTDWEDV